MLGSANLSPDTYIGSHSTMTTPKISGRALTAAVILLILILIFIILLCIYIKNKCIPTFVPRDTGAPIPNRGIECSVCLCELSDGDKFRLLPNCKHSFHLDCIDMWLHSHFTCPLCRCAVGPVAVAADGKVSRPASRYGVALPNRVVLWRNSGRFSTRGLSAYSERSLVIGIPPNWKNYCVRTPNGPEVNRCPPRHCPLSPKSDMADIDWPLVHSARNNSSPSCGGSSCSSSGEGDVEEGLVRCRVVKEEGSSDVFEDHVGG